MNESVSFSENNGRSRIALFVPGFPFGGGEHSCFGYAQGNLGLGRVLLLAFPLCLSLQMRGDHPSLRFFLASGSAWLISSP